MTRASERQLAATLAALAVIYECPECDERYLAVRALPSPNPAGQVTRMP